MDDARAWQSRPLDAAYPIVYLDCIHVKVRDGGVVRAKSRVPGAGHQYDRGKGSPGPVIAQTEGAKFWLQVVTELKKPWGARHIHCLRGWPQRLPRSHRDCVPPNGRTAMHRAHGAQQPELRGLEDAQSGGRRPAHSSTAATESEAQIRSSRRLRISGVLTTQPSLNHGGSTGRALRRSLVPPEIRKVIYTTNAIESVNMSLRKITKNRGSFPSDDAAAEIVLPSLEQHQQEMDDADQGLEGCADALHDPV